MGVGAAALTPILAATLTAGCSSSADRALRSSEVVIGRAAVGDEQVLLTSEPALVYVSGAGRLRRVTLETPPAKLWGLGSIDGQLYSVAGFVDLVRIVEGRVQRAARYARPIANLMDLPAGIGAQPAVDHAGTPLLWESNGVAHLSPLPGETRRSLGLPRAEEGVLHLLSCSTPVRVVCWLPGSDEVLLFGEHGLTPAVRLSGVRRVAPARLIAQPNRRAIHDVVLTPGGAFIALFDRDGGERPSIAEFDSSGTLLRWLDSRHRLRLLIDADDVRLRAITTSGRLVEVPL